MRKRGVGGEEVRTDVEMEVHGGKGWESGRCGERNMYGYDCDVITDEHTRQVLVS